MYKNEAMTAVFAAELEKLMTANPKLVVVDADLSRANNLLGFRQKFPGRALDVGLQEANMTSMAAGLASYGFIPIITSFACFATRRTCDQIAISVAYAKRNVKILGTDPGLTAEFNGGTHMAVEDMGVLRSIPGMVIFEPADANQLGQALEQIVAHDGPVYIRMLRKSTPPIFGEDYKFDLFKADVIRTGTDITLFATGILVKPALDAADKLKEEGISAEVINVHTIKPIDAETVVASVRKTGAAVTCENHNVIGGLRSAVAEAVTEKYPVPIRHIGMQDCVGEVQKLPFLMERFHLTPDDIVKEAKACLEVKASLTPTMV